MLSVEQLSQYNWTLEKKCKNQNATFQIGKKQNVSVLFMKNIESVHIEQFEFNQNMNKITILSQNCDNLIKIKAALKMSQLKKQSNSQSKSPIKLVSEYFESYPLSNFIQKKQPINRQQFAKLVTQIVSIMAEAQNIDFFHRNIHPNNILISRKQPKKDLSIQMIKLKGWDLFSFQNKDPKKYIKQKQKRKLQVYLHPQLIFDQNAIFSSKHDIWSLGIILHQLMQIQLPFKKPYSTSFDNKRLKQCYQQRQDLLNKENLTIQERIILKMVNFSQEGRFNNWAQIKTYLIMNLQLTLYDFKPMNQVYEAHRRLMAQIVQLYKLIIYNLKYSANIFWYQFKSVVLIFCHALIQFAALINFKFTTRYQFKFGFLNSYQNQQINNLFNILKIQWKSIGNVMLQIFGSMSQSQYMKSSKKIDKFELLLNKKFFLHVQEFNLVLIKINLVIDQSKKLKSKVLKDSNISTSDNIQLLHKFCKTLTKNFFEIENNNKKILPVFYEYRIF